MKSISLVATIDSGVYAKSATTGDAHLLQPSDLLYANLNTTEISATKIHLTRSQERHLLQPGDILLIAKGLTHACFLLPDLEVNAVASTAFFVIRPVKSSLLPEYLCWYLNLPATQSRLATIAKGTSIPALTIQDFSQFMIQFPTITIQHAIVTLARMQQRKKELEATLVKHADTLFQHQLLTLANQSA